MVSWLALAFVLPLPLFRSGTRDHINSATWHQLLAAFNQRGVAVITTHPRCREANLYGLYVRGSREVVVCPRGDASNTLRHEGWHAIQSLCLRGQPWLTRRVIEQHLNATDRHELQLLVAPERWQREAEARAMANLNTTEYLQALNDACSTPSQPER